MTQKETSSARGRIAIVEDEPLIVLDIEQAVISANCSVVGVAYRLNDALRMLSVLDCDGVVLDANINGESAEPIVNQLNDREIPFVIVSGYTRNQIAFAEHSTPVLKKPFALDELASLIQSRLVGTKQK